MSRKIDAMVAEKVMGWTLSKRVGYGWPTCGAKVPPSKVATYASRHAAVLGVVGKMNERGLWLSAWQDEDTKDWWVQWCKGDLCNGELGEANADTLSLAVCIAALRAVGVPEDEIQAAIKEDGR